MCNVTDKHNSYKYIIGSTFYFMVDVYTYFFFFKLTYALQKQYFLIQYHLGLFKTKSRET